MVHADNAFPRRVCLQQFQAGLLAFGSTRLLRLPAMHVDVFDVFHSGQFAEPVPDYSGGTTTDFHRLPFSLAPAMPIRCSETRNGILQTEHCQRAPELFPQPGRHVKTSNNEAPVSFLIAEAEL